MPAATELQRLCGLDHVAATLQPCKLAPDASYQRQSISSAAMRESYQGGGGGQRRDSEAVGGTPSLWLPPPSQRSMAGQRRVAFRSAADMQLSITGPADRHSVFVPATAHATDRQRDQRHGRKPTSNVGSAEHSGRGLSSVQFELMPLSTVGHGSSERAQRSAPARFASLLAAPAQRSCESGQSGTRAASAAAVTRWDGKPPVLAPLEQVCSIATPADLPYV